jgi:hypothetical protein
LARRLGLLPELRRRLRLRLAAALRQLLKVLLMPPAETRI